VLSIEELFHSGHSEFYKTNQVSEHIRTLLDSQEINVDLFDKLTLKKQDQ